MKQIARSRFAVFVVGFVVLLAACGGGGRAVTAAPLGADIAEGPIGGGAVPGTGVDTALECPAGIGQDSEEWVGPAELTMGGAVAEAFGELIVGWIGAPVELETTDTWSSWGLRDNAGNLVAVATVASAHGGWGPSHARYCVMPRPVPSPPPFTLYVSNQSFDDPTVRITISIDDQVVVEQDFDVESQHSWIKFEPEIGPGDHSLRAVSDSGAEYTVNFAVPGGKPRWAVVDYWWYPKQGVRQFTFDISDKPIGFA